MKKLIAIAFVVSLPFAVALQRAAAGPLEDSKMMSGVKVFGDFDPKNGGTVGTAEAVRVENSGGLRKALNATAYAAKERYSYAVPQPNVSGRDIHKYAKVGAKIGEVVGYAGTFGLSLLYAGHITPLGAIINAIIVAAILGSIFVAPAAAWFGAKLGSFIDDMRNN